MSPASAGSLEVERYVGACLISRNRTAKTRDQFPQQQHRDFAPDLYRHQHVNYHLQRCQSADGWAGGMPLISFANSQRRPRRNDQDQDVGSLARLAVHTHGAPLILSKSFNHKKSKSVKKCADAPKKQTSAAGGNSVDAVSVTSDESSGSTNSETCLPRIIKPRKRRKKDRKPPLLGRPSSLDGFSTDSASPDIDSAQSGFLSFTPFVPFTFDPYGFSLPDSPKLIDRVHILGDISETPKLHHSFEDIEEPDDSKDINGNQTTSTCQCRYCDPSGQIWDVDRHCYSPFLTPPDSHSKTFQFPSLNALLSTSTLEHCMSSVSLEDEDGKKIPTSRSSSSSSFRDLEVSTEIVTSLNGHRDLEIKFFSSSSVAEDAKDKVSAARRCDVNSELGLASEE